MPATDSFEAFYGRLNAGDSQAAEQLHARFTRGLLQLARGALGGWVRARLDEEDVIQSVYRSFFEQCRAGELQARDWRSLWALLAVMTARKCINRMEHHRAARRDPDREVRLNGPGPGPQLAADEPTPLEAAALAETLELVLNGLEARDRRILLLHLDGHSIPEISAEIGWARRTVSRTLERLRNRARRLLEADLSLEGRISS
jgi:RNA polymerase sigma-70 factor (ECF subfamily)